MLALFTIALTVAAIFFGYRLGKSCGLVNGETSPGIIWFGAVLATLALIVNICFDAGFWGASLAVVAAFIWSGCIAQLNLVRDQGKETANKVNPDLRVVQVLDVSGSMSSEDFLDTSHSVDEEIVIEEEIVVLTDISLSIDRQEEVVVDGDRMLSIRSTDYTLVEKTTVIHRRRIWDAWSMTYAEEIVVMTETSVSTFREEETVVMVTSRSMTYEEVIIVDEDGVAVRVGVFTLVEATTVIRRWRMWDCTPTSMVYEEDETVDQTQTTVKVIDEEIFVIA